MVLAVGRKQQGFGQKLFDLKINLAGKLSIIVSLTLTLLIILTCACPAAQKGYLDYVSDALISLETGQTQDSIENLKKAIECNSNDPLAHVALGLTLVSGRRTDDALAEFKAALDIDDSCAEAIYGQALIQLTSGELGPATATFCQAQSADPDLEMQGAIEYVKSLAGGSYSPEGKNASDESIMALNAVSLMNQRRWADAASIWLELQKTGIRQSLGERFGCTMTMRKEYPLFATGLSLKKGYRSPSVYKANLPVVSGKVVLKADLAKARTVHMVSFFIDNKLVGISNQSLQYTWDTIRFDNGAHNVKIQGNDIDGNIISEKAMAVLVKNMSAALRKPKVRSSEESAVWSRLWEMLKLKPSVAAVSYSLAQCAEKLNDRELEIGALERVLAADPDYLDTAKRLIRLNSPDGKYVRISKGDSNQKIVALTFDDGPKEKTADLLDILKEKGIKATFFVVGKQVEIFPDMLIRMYEEGHEIQNHTYSHRDMEYLSVRDITQEIFRTSSIVRSYTGRGTQYVRPPGGHEGKKFPEVAKRFGIKAVFYTTNCSKLEGTNKKKIYDYEIATAKPGAIILMHNPELVTLQALPDVIDTLKSEGYKFVTLSELVRQGGMQ